MGSSLISNSFWSKYNLLNQTFDDGLDLSRSNLKFNYNSWLSRLNKVFKQVLKNENLTESDMGFLENYLEEDNDLSDFSIRDAILTKTHLYFSFGDSSDSLFFLYDHSSKTYVVADDLREGRYSFEKKANDIISNNFENTVKSFLTQRGTNSIVKDNIYAKLFEFGVGVPFFGEYIVPIVLNNDNIGSRYYHEIAPIIEVNKDNLLMLEDSSSIYEKYKDIGVELNRFTQLISKFIKPNVDIVYFQNVYIDYYNRTMYLQSNSGEYIYLGFGRKVGIVFDKWGTFKEKFEFSNIDESIVLGLMKAIQTIAMSVKSSDVELTYPVLEYNLNSQTVTAVASKWGIGEDSSLLKQLSKDLLGIS